MGQVQVRAGWGGEILRNASPQSQARAQLADLQYEQERERQARERQILAGDLEASALGCTRI